MLIRMNEEEILRQEEKDRRRKKEWWDKHLILKFFNNLRINLWRFPPDD